MPIAKRFVEKFSHCSNCDDLKAYYRWLHEEVGTVLGLIDNEQPVDMKNYEYAVIIDDDTDLCLLLKAILKDLIPHIKFAHSIESGQKLLSQFKPDIIFLDNNLPDGQGVSRIEEIKSKSPGSLLIIITASAFSREQSLKNGADLFVEKPFTYSNIFKALSSLGAN